MKPHKQEEDRMRTEGEDVGLSKPKPQQFQLSSGQTLQFGRPIKLPFINVHHNTSQLTERNRTMMRSLVDSTFARKYHKDANLELSHLKAFRNSHVSPDQRDVFDPLSSVRHISPRNSIKYVKPKVKKVFPEISDSAKQWITELLKKGYKVVEKVGEGSYAKVYKVSRDDGDYAAKIYLRAKIKSEEAMDNIRSEIDTLKKCSHPNVIKLLESFETSCSINIVTDLFQGSTLSQHLKGNKKADPGEAKRIFKQLMSAVKHLHQRGIFHRDLKLDNILIDKSGEIRLIDFGFATQDSGKLLSVCGTNSYIAPEILLKRGYKGQQADIWSCGVILYRLVVGSLPFKAVTDKQLYDRIIGGEIRFPAETDKEARQIMEHMLDMTPGSRMEAGMVSVR